MKYAPGLLAGQLSGSVGSTTASHNRFGSYFRSRVIPVNPNSFRQQDVRAVLTNLTQQWKTLTESQRIAWGDLALQIPRTDPLGVSYFQTGQQLYVGLNAKRSTVGFAVIADAPALDDPPSAVAPSLTATVAAGGTLDWAYTSAGGVAGNRFLLRATGTRSPGKTYIAPSEYKIIAAFAGNAASPFDAQPGYETFFGAGWLAQAGMEIAMSMEAISPNGFAGGVIFDVATIA